MRPPLSLAILTSLALLSFVGPGCNRPNKKDATGATTAATTTGTATLPPTVSLPAPAPAPTASVGSRFWYEGDSFGTAFKTHSAAEADFAQQVLILTNQERTSRGLNALLNDPEAELAAKVHCEDMAARNFFDHFTPEGWSPLDRLVMTGGGGFTASGENVAFGQPDPATVVTAWMNSPGHRANILFPDFTHLGVGVAEATPHWAQVFLRR